MTNNPKYIIVHCTDVSEKALFDQFTCVNKYHQGLGFDRSDLGYYVGYHRLITGGKNYKCRNDAEEGDHTNQSENGLTINLQSLGVCVGFDGDIEFPSEVHTNLLREQILTWQAAYNIPDMNVLMHRHFALYKTCPGSKITQWWINELIAKDVIPTPKPSAQIDKQSALLNIQEQLGFARQALLKLQLLFNFLFKKS